MFSLVQDYLAGTQITKAWVFGSFSRGEEKPDSDLDLLIDYDRSSQISLLDLIRYKIDLEKLIHREVDLIEEKSLKPFAVPSAERDKYLIYAR
ncbi:MAG: nucleotidyltransferase domain-containing protein [Bacteroidales bacterium]|nr:nucleotidyltransferase domain-containing protein [Bacteroidales bacterium]